jgi:hypothetical protein
MMRALLSLGAAMMLLASPACRSEGFAFSVASPKFSVSIPGIPQIKMVVHPNNASQPQLRFQGLEDPYAVTVYTPAAPPGMTPLECAGAIAKVLAARPGTPPPSEIVKARLDENTYVAIYATPLVGGVQLHAHLLSAAGGTHCVEVHATRISIEEDDLASWITELENARIKSD